MPKVIRLRLIEENSVQGFPVILEVMEEGVLSHREYDNIGFLPPLPQQLEASFANWQSTYRELTDARSIAQPGTRLSPKPGVTNRSYSEHSDELEKRLNEWLNSVDSRWQPIRDGLIANRAVSGEEIRVIVETDDIRLRRLPWQEWDLFAEYYPQAEIALSVPVKAASIIPPPSYSQVRILVAVGKSDGINTEFDLEVIQNLKARGAEVISLLQPKPENLYNALRDETGYHIFIFTGHSGSQEDGQIGWIEVNETDSLRIKDFKDALKRAIKNGLQLAIFNSCDGLGLARQLAEYNLPQSIVMREPIPDPVAQDFLKHFFAEFVGGKSLFSAVREARERLEHWNLSYPGAKWLPTICINPSVQPLTWQELGSAKVAKPLPPPTAPPPANPPQNFFKVAIASGMIGAVVGGAIALSVTKIFAPPQTYKPSTFFSLKETTPNAVPRATLRYGGSTAWAPIRRLADEKIKKDLVHFNIVYTQHPTQASGSGTGIKMLLDGQLSFAQASRPISDSEYEIAARRGLRLKQVPVAIDGIAIVVHPDLNVSGLTIAQLQGIYTGKITEWSKIGGPPLKIKPYTPPLGSGATELFKEAILTAENWGKNVVSIQTPTEALKKVGQPQNTGEIGGIYFASASNLVGQCNVKPLPISRHAGSPFTAPYEGKLVPRDRCPAERNSLNIKAFQNGEYPLTRRLFAIVKQDGQIDEQAGEAYARLLLTDEGQKLIEKAGFIPIRSK